MPRSRKRETKRKSIAIQTDHIDSNIEITRLQEQLKLLQLENDTLKRHVNDSIPSVEVFSNRSTLESMQTPRKVNKISKGNSQVLGSATKPKLCACKGNCSSKICGCVKNERKCGPTCKCNDQICQNQELENKENVEAVQNEIIDKLENLPLKDETTHKNWFSSENIENEACLSNIQFQDIRFDTQRKLTYTSDEDLQRKNESKIKDDIITKSNIDQKENKGIGDKEHLIIPKESTKIKLHKTNTNKINKNQAQELTEFKSKIIQASPLSEEDNKMSMLETDANFDPMKPKRQLPRTPPRDNIEYEPDILTTVETFTEKIQLKVDIIPDELNQENVDLSKLQIELVSCDRCKRKFYPWRIAVHKSACLGL